LKKLLILLIFLSSTLFAGENYELKLYEKILPIIFQTDKLVVYVDSSSKEIFKNSNIFTITSDCDKATVVIGKNLKKSCPDKPFFATSHRSFENLENSFGVFYWRNGIPNIKFNSSNIIKFNLFLPQSLKKYSH